MKLLKGKRWKSVIVPGQIHHEVILSENAEYRMHLVIGLR